MTRTMILAVSCLVLLACGEGGTADTTEQAADTTEAAPATTSAGPETTMAAATPTADTTSPPETTEDEAGPAGTITMQNISFSGTTTVQAGDTIEVVNQDEVPHTFTAEGGVFDVPVSPGNTVTYTFEEPGEYSYFCSIHPSMTGTITVEG